MANPPLDTLARRIARLRVQVARTLRDAQDASARAREVSQTTSTSRRRRWARRYEQAFERNAKELEDLNL